MDEITAPPTYQVPNSSSLQSSLNLSNLRSINIHKSGLLQGKFLLMMLEPLFPSYYSRHFHPPLILQSCGWTHGESSSREGIRRKESLMKSLNADPRSRLLCQIWLSYDISRDDMGPRVYGSYNIRICLHLEFPSPSSLFAFLVMLMV